MRVRVGPIQVRLDGRVILAERDEATRQASDGPAGGGQAVERRGECKMRLQLFSAADGQQTDVEIHTDANVMGKLGEFGQAVIRKKADQIVQDFATNLSSAVTARG